MSCRATSRATRSSTTSRSTWLTNTGVSSARLYWENKLGFFDAKDVTVPCAVSVFPDELYQAPRSWAERAYPEPHLLQRARPGRPLRRLAAAGALHEELRAAFRSLRTTRRSSSRADFGPVRQIDAGVLDVGYVERPGRRPGRPAAARLAVRHPQLRRGRAAAGASGLPGDRPVPARLRHDALPAPTGHVRNGQQAALARRRDRPDGRARDRPTRSSPASTGARGRPTSSRRCGRSAATALVSVSGYLIGSQEAGRQPLPPEAELAVVVPVLLRHRARPGRLRDATGASSRGSSGGPPRRSGTSTTPRSIAARRPSTTRTTSPS